MKVCQYEDLFERCDSPASHSVHWRRWGRARYCCEHFRELAHDAPSDLLEAVPV